METQWASGHFGYHPHALGQVLASDHAQRPNHLEKIAIRLARRQPREDVLNCAPPAKSGPVARVHVTNADENAGHERRQCAGTGLLCRTDRAVQPFQRQRLFVRGVLVTSQVIDLGFGAPYSFLLLALFNRSSYPSCLLFAALPHAALGSYSSRLAHRALQCFLSSTQMTGTQQRGDRV